ncbi:MAG: TIR domain-containing protein [Pseudonocardia sp.]
MTIFLSYARTDEPVVKTLARAFEAARREVWYDHDLNGGDIWWPTLLEHLRESQVFLFALSDSSLKSRACLEELDYAEKLGLPILPVRVGPVATQQTNPLAGMQFVQFRVDDAVSGSEVLAAADRAAARCPPLPVPLPSEPPIPFAYLQQITHQINAAELSPQAQLDVIAELRKAIAEETDKSVREEIVAILNTLLGKPWRTMAAGAEIQYTIAAYRAMEAEIARLVDAPPEEIHQVDGPEHPRADDSAGTDPDPNLDPAPDPRPSPDSDAPDPAQDPEAIFRGRVEEIAAQRLGAETERNIARDRVESPEEIFARRTEEVFGQLRAGAAVRQARGTTTPRNSENDQSLAFPGVRQPQAAWVSASPGIVTEAGAARRHREPTGDSGSGGSENTAAHGEPANRDAPAERAVKQEPPRSAEPVDPAPPTRRSLAVAALLLSLLGALAAVSASASLVVPFAVSAATAVVALRFSAEVGRRCAMSDVRGAHSASHTAMVWAMVALTLIGAVVGIVGLLAVTSPGSIG